MVMAISNCKDYGVSDIGTDKYTPYEAMQKISEIQIKLELAVNDLTGGKPYNDSDVWKLYSNSLKLQGIIEEFEMKSKVTEFKTLKTKQEDLISKLKPFVKEVGIMSIDEIAASKTIKRQNYAQR
jgi:hypothetical protein